MLNKFLYKSASLEGWPSPDNVAIEKGSFDHGIYETQNDISAHHRSGAKKSEAKTQRRACWQNGNITATQTPTHTHTLENTKNKKYREHSANQFHLANAFTDFWFLSPVLSPVILSSHPAHNQCSSCVQTWNMEIKHVKSKQKSQAPGRQGKAGTWHPRQG